MTKYVRVTSEGGVRRFPLTEEDGPLALSTLRSRFPTARGLSYFEDEDEVVVPSQNDIISPPLDGWGNRQYSVLVAEGTLAKNEGTGSPSQVVTPRPQLVMAPERKITPFDGKPEDVQDFVAAITAAFLRYAIPVGQRAAFLVDYLRGIPKLEVKALVAEGQSAEEILGYLKQSCGDKLAVGELQRLFLERKQRRGECVRDFAVDLERRFLRLAGRDAKLYTSPDSALVEQFVEGLSEPIMRNTCRDLYERGTATTFRELREYAIQREGREEARDRAVGAAAAQLATVQLDRKEPNSSPEIQGAIRGIADGVVRAVEEMMRPLMYPTHPQSFQGPLQHPPGGPSRRAQNAGWPGQRGLCYACGLPGHFARECPSGRRPSGPPRQWDGYAGHGQPSQYPQGSTTPARPMQQEGPRPQGPLNGPPPQ